MSLVGFVVEFTCRFGEFVPQLICRVLLQGCVVSEFDLSFVLGAFVLGLVFLGWVRLCCVCR